MSENYFINKHTGALSAYTINDFVEGLKYVVESGGSIGDPNKAFKAGALYHAEIIMEVTSADNILTREALEKELSELNSKSKVANFAQGVYARKLQSKNLEEMKEELLEEIFPTPRVPFNTLEIVGEQVDWFREGEEKEFDQWAESVGIKIDGRLTLDKAKASFMEQYTAMITQPEETEEESPQEDVQSSEDLD